MNASFCTVFKISFAVSSQGGQKTDALAALLMSCGAGGAAAGWGGGELGELGRASGSAPENVLGRNTQKRGKKKE